MLDKFLALIPDEPKLPNYVTASGSNSILDQLTHLRAQGIYRSGGVPDQGPTRLGHGAVLAASKPVQVFKYPSIYISNCATEKYFILINSSNLMNMLVYN